ncbi:MAG: ATP-binding protein [Desulfobaccales bacterium]
MLVLVSLGWGGGRTQETAPLARHGVLDLSGWDLEQDGTVNLAGEWEFYWGQLLTPADFHQARLPEISGYLKTSFFTTKPPGRGTGLGLSIAQGIIADHGGALRLESLEGVSTTVTIDLPVAEDE